MSEWFNIFLLLNKLNIDNESLQGGRLVGIEFKPDLRKVVKPNKQIQIQIQALLLLPTWKAWRNISNEFEVVI